MIKVFSFVLISIECISKTQATDIISNENTISIGDYGILSNQPLDITNYNLGTIYGNSTTGYGFGVENSASINLNNSSINSIYGKSSIDAAWGIRSQDTITVNNTSGGSIYGSGDADGYGIASPNLITINNSGSGSIYGESSRQNAYGLSFGDMNVINSGSGSIYGTTLSGSSYGIYSLGNSTIENSGSSSIYAATAFGSAFGIYSAGNITLENLESAKIYGETMSGPVWGILSNGNIQINNSIDAKISASTNGGDAIGIQTSSNLKILNDGEISSRSIGVTNSIAIQTSDQTDFELLNNGIIEATGDNNVIAIGNFGISEQLINNNQIIAMSNFVSNGILNSNGTIQSLINYGTINASGVSTSYGISNYTDSTAFGEYPVDGYINNLTNAGNILSSAGWSIGNSALITTITNTGSIIGAGGIGNDGYILEINNSNNVEATGEPLPGEGAAIGSVGTIGSISNTGNIISAKQYGIGNGGTITTITNSGIISAAEGDGIANRIGTYFGTPFAGNITSIENKINAEIIGQLDGITNSYQIGTISNNGIVNGINDFGILNAGQLLNLNNTGVIKGKDSGVLNYASKIYGAPIDIASYVGVINSISNSGLITGNYESPENYSDNILISHGCIKSDDTVVPCGAGSGIINQRGQIDQIVNQSSGIIETKNLYGASGIWNKFGYIGSITNYGKILSLDLGQDIEFQDPLKKKENYGIFNFGYFTESHTTREMIGEGIGNLNNIGIISAIDIAVINSSGIKDFSNSGTINGAVVNSGYIESLVNSGKIISETVTFPTIGSIGFGNDGNILSLENTGSISGKDYGLVNLWNIDSLVNKGILSGGTYDLNNLNPGLESFTNGQGGNGSGAKKTALTYSGILPTSYYIYVTSKTQYGQITFSNVTGSMNFDIASGSVLSTGTYSNVLSGIDNTNLANLNGSFGARSWSLVNAGSKYNLVISAPNSQDMSTIPSNQDGSKTIPSGTSAKIAQLTASDNITIGSGGSLDDSGTSDPVKVSGGSLKVESGGTVTTAIKVQGGSVEIASGGTLISEDTVTVTDGILIVGGTINAPIALSTGRKFSLADLVSFSPVFTLSSGGTVIGPLTIDAAGARVNGTIQGSVTIGDGAALRGTGIITGESTVSSGGILAPGNSPGIMTFTASLTQGSGSTLSLDIDGTTAGTGAGYYSQVLVTGSGNTYTIGSGATIQPNLRDITGSANNTFTPSIGDVFTVVSADGGVSGTFSTLTQPSSGLTSGTRFIDLYTSTEVQLKVVKSGYSTIGSSTNSNLGNVGSAIDSISGMTGDRSTLMNAIFALSSDTDSTTALKQLSGDIQTVSPIAAVQSSRAIGAVVDNRMASVRGGTTDTSLNSELFDFSSLTTTGTSQVVGSIIKGFSLATDQEFSDSKPWMKVLTRSSSGSSDSNGLVVNSSTVGAAAGIDYTLNSKWLVGAAIGVASNSITNGQTVTTTSASLYGSHDIGSAYIASRLSFALDDYRGSRSIEFGTISRSASANTYGYQLGGAIELGNRYRFGTVSGEIYGSFESGWLQREAYTESGADSANLTVDELKAQTSTSKLGVRLNSILNQTESGSFQAFSDFAWGHDFGDTSITTSHTVMGGSFSLEGPNVGRDSAEIGFGIVSENKKGYRFFAKYAGEFRKMEVSRTAELGVTMIW